MSMKTYPIMAGALALAASAAWGQSVSNSAFTAAGSSCDQVTWSDDALAKYPHIASACQEVVNRDGKYFVKFQGEVRRVAKGGREITVEFKGGDSLRLAPSKGMSVDVGGKETPVEDLRPGSVLNFFVPQDQLAAQFPQGTRVSVPIPMSAPEPQHVALLPHATMAASPPKMPKTAGELPGLGLLGSMLVALGAVLTIHRRTGRSS
jgi:hypothetical protein